MTTQPPGTYDEARPSRRAPWGLFVATGVLFLLSLGTFVGGIVGFAADGTQEEDLQRIEVPGEGAVQLDEAGAHTIFYESSQFVETGVCERRTRRIDDRTRTYLECQEDLLEQAPPPTVRPEGGDSIQVEPAGGTIAAFDLDEHLPVWTFVADEPGTYELELDEAPLGTETISVGRDGGHVPAWAAWLLVLSVILGFVTFVLFVVAIVLLLVRLSRNTPGRAGPPPPPPGAGWAPPAGRPTGVVPPPPGHPPGSPTGF